MRLRNQILSGTAVFVLLSGGADAAYASIQSSSLGKSISVGAQQYVQSNSIKNKTTVANIVNTTNLRKGPGLDYDIVAKAKAGDSLPIVGTKGDWYLVSLSGSSNAYVANWVVETDVVDSSKISSNAGQNSSSTAEKNSVQDKKSVVSIVDTTNLRKGPGLNYEIVAKAKVGEAYSIIGSKGDWYQVSLPSGGTAYVANWVVKTGTASQSDNKVYIYHTHNRESWKNVSSNTKGVSIDDPKVNITLVGKQLAQSLQKKGIPSIIEESDFANKMTEQKLGYSQAYSISRKAVDQAIQSNSSLSYFFDIHRDSDVPRSKTTALINGKSYARIMFVIGDANPNHKENKKFAEALIELLNKKYPGLSRGILLKSSHQGNGEYNQSISNGSLLLEVGGVNNTLQESLLTAEAFANVFAEYYKSNK
ncbi:stage II sporulation protein P [Paenibacillus sp. FSL H8-0548]|uniref:stage II sporulation protein P n=1 Tax=Paenibacillus sp. FSL H8-0548 TaxID=1920422 RepID=UPI00117EC44A|nr:stage II sporulation protein P [Paenibacillus sp. FSL H8-0548]